MKKDFSIKKLFSHAWQDYKKHWLLFLGVLAVVFLLGTISNNIGYQFDPFTGAQSGSRLVTLLFWLVNVLVSMGLINIALKVVDKRKPELSDIFTSAQSWKHYFVFLVAGLIVGLSVFVGTILLIIPGIIAAISLMFVRYYTAENRYGLSDALKQSWHTTKGARWKIFWLSILIIVFNMIGVAALIVGLVITIPMSQLIFARLYRQLDSYDMNQDVGDVEFTEMFMGDAPESVVEVTDVVIEPGDLTKIEGIGPMIAKALNDIGIMSFAQLADMTPETIASVIADIRGNHDTSTWPKQAALARDGKWEELQEWQDKLDGGRE